jgi:hypothetical protein
MKAEIDNSRKTTFISVLTMEEIPLLSEAERAALEASLAEAQADAAAARGKPFDAETFVADAMARRAQFAAKKDA